METHNSNVESLKSGQTTTTEIINSWTIEGYKPPKTCLFMSRKPGLSKSIRRPFTEETAQQKLFIDPCKYGETIESSFKKNWLNDTGHFTTAKRETLTAKSMKRSASTPGPGHYFQVNKDTRKTKIHIKLGKFDKADKGSFLNDIQAASLQVPGPNKYNIAESKKNRFTNSMYHLPYYKGIKEPNPVGPGTYSDNIDTAYNKHILNSSIKSAVPKAKRLSFTEIKAKKTSTVPGAGAYSGAASFGTISFLSEKLKKHSLRFGPKRVLSISRFTDLAAKAKNWVPGVGSYDLGPKSVTKS
jgi:hypothetical protein